MEGDDVTFGGKETRAVEERKAMEGQYVGFGRDRCGECERGAASRGRGGGGRRVLRGFCQGWGRIQGGVLGGYLVDSWVVVRDRDRCG